jgi:hypothetical protein
LATRIADDFYAANVAIPDSALTPNIATCNFGFLQEYPLALLLGGERVTRAASFCASVGARLNDLVPGAEAECWRGMGRGLPFIDKALWGDPYAMAKLGVSQCKTLATNTSNYEICLSGVFYNIGRQEVNRNYKLSVNTQDPMKLCKEQRDSATMDRCFGNYKLVAVSLVDKSDIASAVERLYSIYGKEGSSYVQSAVWLFGYEHAAYGLLDKPLDENAISLCMNLSPQQRQWCIDGMSVGLAKNGRPGMQGTQVLSLCARVFKSIPDFPTDYCPSRQAVGYIRGFYAPAQFERFCASMKQRLGFACKEEPVAGYGY